MCTILKIPAVYKFGNTCLQTHSDGNSVGWQDPFLGETPSSREQVCSGKGNIGPTLGVIQTGSATQRNQNARTFGERYIECTLIIEEKWQEHQLCRCITICSPFPALFLGLDSPNRVPRAMLLHFFWKLRERERELIHCGFRSCISYDDKGPPVIVIANCTTETTGETTLYVNDLNMFVDFQFLKESPAERSLEHCARRVVFRLRGVQVSHHISSWMWDNIECKNRQLHSFGCPWRAISRSPDTTSGWLEADTSCGRPWARSGNRLARTASKTHGRIDREIVKFDRCFSSLRGNTTASTSSSRRHPPAKPTSSIAGAKHRMFTHFRMQETRNFRDRHAG